MKKALSVILSVLMLISCVSIIGYAEDKTFTALNYNVAGLPDPDVLLLKRESYVFEKEGKIGKIFDESGIDIIAVQEDFNYHDNLVAQLTSYDYMTIHSGGIPVGDGMNIYSKFPIYNVERQEWKTRAGIFDDGSDALTPKGILYSVIEIEKGVYVDFYDIHADAYGGQGSVEARIDNYDQLIAMINKNDNGRPVIITGDFNISSHHAAYEASARHLTDLFIYENGFKDSWTELYNGGDYEDYSAHESKGGYWGVWDSVEKFLYRDGKGVTINPTAFEYICYKNEDGESLSDHNAAKVEFAYTVDKAALPGNSGIKAEENNALARFITQLFAFLKAFFLCFSDPQAIKDLFAGI